MAEKQLFHYVSDLITARAILNSRRIQATDFGSSPDEGGLERELMQTPSGEPGLRSPSIILTNEGPTSQTLAHNLGVEQDKIKYGIAVVVSDNHMQEIGNGRFRKYIKLAPEGELPAESVEIKGMYPVGEDLQVFCVSYRSRSSNDRSDSLGPQRSRYVVAKSPEEAAMYVKSIADAGIERLDNKSPVVAHQIVPDSFMVRALASETNGSPTLYMVEYSGRQKDGYAMVSGVGHAAGRNRPDAEKRFGTPSQIRDFEIKGTDEVIIAGLRVALSPTQAQ